MEDGQIVALYWRRDEAALGETQRKYAALCRSVAKNILGGEEDAYKEVMKRLLGE